MFLKPHHYNLSSVKLIVVMFVFRSRIGCYVSVFSAISSLRDTFYKEMSTVYCIRLSSLIPRVHRAVSWDYTGCDVPYLFISLIWLFPPQLNSDLQNVIKDLQEQHPNQVFAVKGLQR